jgi:hypothetical protein
VTAADLAPPRPAVAMAADPVPPRPAVPGREREAPVPTRARQVTRGGGGEESTGAHCRRGSGRQREEAEAECRSPLGVRVRSGDNDAGTAGESASRSGRLEEQGLLPSGRWRMG